MKNSYTEKQIEVSNLLSAIDAPQATVDEIMNMIMDQKSRSVMPPFSSESIDAIKLKLLDEKDWHKRAILAASIISKGLE